MTKKERKVLEQLATAMTRCQVLKSQSTSHYAIVNGTHAIWAILEGNYKNAGNDIEELNSLFINLK